MRLLTSFESSIISGGAISVCEMNTKVMEINLAFGGFAGGLGIGVAIGGITNALGVATLNSCLIGASVAMPAILFMERFMVDLFSNTFDLCERLK